MATVMEKYTHELYAPRIVPPTAAPLFARRVDARTEIDPLQNRVLAQLPEAERARLLPQLEQVELPLGKVLHECGNGAHHVHFPTSAVVSLLNLLDDGSSAEAATVGREGVIGFPILMGGGLTPGRTLVVRRGTALRLRAHALTEELNRGGALLQVLLRYSQALLAHMAQMAVCNRHHRLDAQLCRWLLLMLDRSQSDEIVMTQELIASMLGVRREGVTAAAVKLQSAGCIRYRRGRICVLDRAALEQRACECYAVVHGEYERLLPQACGTNRILSLRSAGSDTSPKAARNIAACV